MGEERARHLAELRERARLVFGPRTAYRTPTGRVHEDGQPGPLRELARLRACSTSTGMRPGLGVQVGRRTWSRPGPRATSPSAARCCITYDDGPLAGQAAVVRHGNVTTIGAWSPSLITEILTNVLAELQIPTTALPDGVRVARRGDITTWMNFNLEPVTLADGTTLGPVSFQLRTTSSRDRE